MANIQSVGFTQDPQVQEVERRRQLAQALQQQALTPEQSQTAGGYTVPYSPAQGLMRLAQAYMARKAGDKAEEGARDVYGRQQQRMGADISLLAQALRGRQPSPGGLQEDVTGNVSQMPQTSGQSSVESLGQAIPMMGPQVQPIALQALMEENKPYNLGRGETRMRGSEPIATGQPMPTPERQMQTDTVVDPAKPGRLLVVDRKTYQGGTLGSPGVLGEAPPKGPLATASATATMPKDDKYIEARRKGMAESFDALQKSAYTASQRIKSLDRFIEANRVGTAGNVQPIISGVQNFLATFGYSPESLKDVREMEQVLGDMQAKMMAEFGARGLTDKDMEVLRMSLPRVNIDRASRENIANILKKADMATLSEYHRARQEEERVYPDFAKTVPRQKWYSEYLDQSGSTNTPPPGAVRRIR